MLNLMVDGHLSPVPGVHPQPDLVLRQDYRFNCEPLDSVCLPIRFPCALGRFFCHIFHPAHIILCVILRIEPARNVLWWKVIVVVV
jgi:hypothetical protein